MRTRMLSEEIYQIRSIKCFLNNLLYFTYLIIYCILCSSLFISIIDIFYIFIYCNFGYQLSYLLKQYF